MIPQLKTLEYNVKGDVSIEGQKVASKKKIPHIVWKIFQMLPSFSQVIVDNFSYTGKAPDAFFYVGKSG